MPMSKAEAIAPPCTNPGGGPRAAYERSLVNYARLWRSPGVEEVQGSTARRALHLTSEGPGGAPAVLGPKFTIDTIGSQPAALVGGLLGLLSGNLRTRVGAVHGRPQVA